MERVIRLGLLAIVSLLCASRVAGAQEPPAPPAFAPEAAGAGPHRSAECKGNRATFAVAVHELRTTTFYFASPVLEALSSSRDLIVRPGHMTVTVQPRNTKQAEFGNLRITTMTCEAQIEVRRAERLADAPLRVDVTQVDELALRRRELEEQERKLDEEKRKLDEEKRKVTSEADSMAAQLLLHDRLLTPVAGRIARESDPLYVQMEPGRWFGEDLYFLLGIENPGSQPYLWAQVQATDAAGTLLDAQVVEIESTTTAPEGLLAAIQPKERIRAVIKLTGVAKKHITPLTIQLTAPHGLLPVLVDAQKWEIGPPMYPVSREELAERERLRAEAERERQAKGRVSVHLQGMLGGIWLQDGLGLLRTDATLTRGVGARITYSFNRYLAFETEALGAGTGEAHFADAMWNGMQGELVRSASLGRLLGGAVVRFGDDVLIPLARIGLGFQGASLGSRFLVDGNEVMPGPESVFAFDFAVYFGGGVDVRLGPLEAGLRLSGVKMSNVTSEPTGSASIEAALHVGYGWKP